MQDPNYYLSIEKSAVAEFSDRGSRFLAYAFPVNTVDAFKQLLNGIKKEHPKASHHCFAYRMGIEGQTYRVTDAGEPSGSAGRPILGQIDSKGLTNVCVIVVRYFGGTLLGVTGLINAYKSSASMALQLTPVLRKPVEMAYTVQFDYTVVNEVSTVLKRFGCTIISKEMQLFCLYQMAVAKVHERDCLQQLKDIRGCEFKFDEIEVQ